MEIVNKPFTTTFYAFPNNEVKHVFTNPCVSIVANKIATCVVFNTCESVVYCLHVDELAMSTLLWNFIRGFGSIIWSEGTKTELD